jgi:hypothetical protein
MLAGQVPEPQNRALPQLRGLANTTGYDEISALREAVTHFLGCFYWPVYQRRLHFIREDSPNRCLSGLRRLRRAHAMPSLHQPALQSRYANTGECAGCMPTSTTAAIVVTVVVVVCGVLLWLRRQYRIKRSPANRSFGMLVYPFDAPRKIHRPARVRTEARPVRATTRQGVGRAPKHSTTPATEAGIVLEAPPPAYVADTQAPPPEYPGRIVQLNLGT